MNLFMHLHYFFSFRRRKKTFSMFKKKFNFQTSGLKRRTFKFNYRILVDGLCLSIKIKGKLSNKCFLCDKGGELCIENLESREHLLINCDMTQSLFQRIKHKFKDKDIQLKKEKSILHLDFEENDSKLMAIFNLSIWILRNKVRCDEITNLTTHFIGIFKSLCLKYKLT